MKVFATFVGVLPHRMSHCSTTYILEGSYWPGSETPQMTSCAVLEVDPVHTPRNLLLAPLMMRIPYDQSPLEFKISKGTI